MAATITARDDVVAELRQIKQEQRRLCDAQDELCPRPSRSALPRQPAARWSCPRGAHCSRPQPGHARQDRGPRPVDDQPHRTRHPRDM